MLKMAAIVIGAVLLGFIAAGIVFANFRLFLWIGIIGLIVYAIAGLVMARRSS
jgi:hypothetical protein